MKNRKIVFLCSTYPKEYDNFYRNLSGADSTTSGNIHSSSIIDGFINNNKEYFVISGVGVGHYPLNTKTKKLPEIKYSNNFYSVSYNNHFLISQFSKAKAMYNCFKKECSFRNEALDIILADIHEPFARAALKIRNLNNDSRIVNICLDVPDTIVSSKEKILRKFLKRISIRRNLRLLRKMDGFVLLSKHMINRLPILDKPYFVSPFIADINLYENLRKRQHNKITITYCGVLSIQYNIDLLLDAFKLINGEQFELVLAGKGDGINLIRDRSLKDRRIKYVGEISRDDALQLQIDSDVLVNPRLPEEKYTSFSFPSKTIAYLLTCNPVVCYTFPSFPLDIKKMVFEPKQTNASSLAEMILFACHQKSRVNLEILKNYSSSKFVEQLDGLFFNIRKKYE